MHHRLDEHAVHVRDDGHEELSVLPIDPDTVLSPWILASPFVRLWKDGESWTGLGRRPMKGYRGVS